MYLYNVVSMKSVCSI